MEGVHGYGLVRDEVAFARTYSLVYGLQEDPKIATVVGGAWPDAASIPCPEGTMQGLKLDREKLSALSVCTAVRRCDRRNDLFLVQQIPRTRVTNAWDELRETGLIAESCGQSAYSILLFCFLGCEVVSSDSRSKPF